MAVFCKAMRTASCAELSAAARKLLGNAHDGKKRSYGALVYT